MYTGRIAGVVRSFLLPCIHSNNTTLLALRPRPGQPKGSEESRKGTNSIMKSEVDHEKALADMRERMRLQFPTGEQEAPENQNGDIPRQQGSLFLDYPENGKGKHSVSVPIEQSNRVFERIAKSLERIAVILDRGSQAPITHKDGERLTYRVSELAASVGVCDRVIRDEIKKGQLRAHFVSGTVIILIEDAEEWLRSRPVAPDEAE